MTVAFDNDKYFKIESEAIKERISKFSGKLYFEVGGKFIHDSHAARILPGFDPEIKIQIIKGISTQIDIIFCINSQEINNKRILKNGQSYYSANLDLINKLRVIGFKAPKIALNLYSPEEETLNLEAKLKSDGHEIFHRFKVEGYPEDVNKIIGPEGFGKDDYIATNSNFVLVIAAEPNSGKMSTCLGQIYLDSLKGIDSGYAKYETFPVWNLPIDHPINLAYEAATADIEDFNTYDMLHEQAYGVKSVNYNRDVEAFPIIKNLIAKIVSPDNFMTTYKSPTDMGISRVGDCIIDEAAIKEAVIVEIKRRKNEYAKMVEAGDGKQEWVEKCEQLLKKL